MKLTPIAPAYAPLKELLDMDDDAKKAMAELQAKSILAQAVAGLHPISVIYGEAMRLAFTGCSSDKAQIEKLRTLLQALSAAIDSSEVVKAGKHKHLIAGMKATLAAFNADLELVSQVGIKNAEAMVFGDDIVGRA